MRQAVIQTNPWAELFVPRRLRQTKAWFDEMHSASMRCLHLPHQFGVGCDHKNIASQREALMVAQAASGQALDRRDFLAGAAGQDSG